VLYRDRPTTEVAVRIATDLDAACARVTDIALPITDASELQAVRWLDGATAPVVGARFEGDNANPVLGEWTTTSTVVEVDPPRRWVWEVGGADGPWATWGFELDPVREDVVVRQWVRIGPARSGLNLAIDAAPEREARIVEVRLGQLADAMRASLEGLKAELEGR